MDTQNNRPDTLEPVQTPPTPTKNQDTIRSQRMIYLKRQRNIRIAAIALAIILALISLLVSCNTQRAIKDLSEKIAAKKAAQETLASTISSAEETVDAELSAVPDGAVTLTVSFVGDITLSSYEGADYNGSFEEYQVQYGNSYFFQNVKSIFEGDDLTVANLEGTLTTSSNREDKDWTFRADPSYADILVQGNIDCVNVANNHTHDYGDEGYVDTLATLDNAGIYRFGSDYTTIAEVKGVKIGFSGIAAFDDGLACQEQAVENVKTLQEQGAQIIICSFHWGDENSYTTGSVETVLAQAVIDAGADLVVAHHPRVLQGISTYKGKYICYSLGSFCYGSSSTCKDQDTVIFQQTFTLVDGILQDDADYTLIPCSISSSEDTNNYCPTPASGTKAQRILDKIYNMSGELDGGISPESNSSVA